MTTFVNKFDVALKKLAGSFKAWNEMRAARAALMNMDDDLLRDIGLTRSDIDLAIRGGIVRPTAQVISLDAFKTANKKVSVPALPKAA